MKTSDSKKNPAGRPGEAIIKKIPVDLAAAMMGKYPQYIRIGLQRRLLPIGSAVKINERNKRYDYHISAKKFSDYTGFDQDAIIAYAEKHGYNLPMITV